MASLKWSGGPGLWSDANWIVISGTDSVPGPTTDATIDAPLNYVVTVAGAQSVHNVLINAAGAKLQIAGTLTLGGTLVDQAGTLVLPLGGVLQGGTVQINSGSTSFTGGTLDSVTWLGPLTLATDAVISVTNTITLLNPDASPGGTLELGGGGGHVEFTNSQTLDRAVIHAAPFGRSSVSFGIAAGVTLTLGPQTLLEGAFSQSTFAILGGGTLRNTGSVHLVASSLGGGLSIEGTMVNDGRIDVAPFGALGTTQNLVSSTTIHSDGSIYIDGNLLSSGVVELGYYETNGFIFPSQLFVGGTIAAGTHLDGQGNHFYIQAGFIDPGVTIDGFGNTSTIDITGLAFTGSTNGFWSGNLSGGTLTIKDGAVTTASVFLTGVSSDATFSVVNDGHGGTKITTNNIPCFRAGTRIRTLRGEVAVEDLRPGDLLPALKSGRPLPVRWTGHRHVDANRHRDREAVWPVRIRRDAIAPGIPARDLWLSPEHAVFLHGVLVPVRCLINKATITQLPQAHITYWHVELDVHDLILAEAMPSETFLDMGNRNDFANPGPLTAHPLFGGRGFGANLTPAEHWRAHACAPQVRGGWELAAIRKTLINRAVRLGYFHAREGQAA